MPSGCGSRLNPCPSWRNPCANTSGVSKPLRINGLIEIARENRGPFPRSASPFMGRFCPGIVNFASFRRARYAETQAVSGGTGHRGRGRSPRHRSRRRSDGRSNGAPRAAPRGFRTPGRRYRGDRARPRPCPSPGTVWGRTGCVRPAAGPVRRYRCRSRSR